MGNWFHTGRLGRPTSNPYQFVQKQVLMSYKFTKTNDKFLNEAYKQAEDIQNGRLWETVEKQHFLDQTIQSKSTKHISYKSPRGHEKQTGVTYIPPITVHRYFPDLQHIEHPPKWPSRSTQPGKSCLKGANSVPETEPPVIQEGGSVGTTTFWEVPGPAKYHDPQPTNPSQFPHPNSPSSLTARYTKPRL